ncbi:MAG: ATP-dependent RecD-like DNA helicase, partial [Deltaproteobacteria bacterium]|nr:ATP-dependent RecD-like DNA helicase [Deltaproteobacteria bacterium]
FKVVSSETKTPASLQGLEKYLGSGLIKGIGPVMAERIVKKFGLETLSVIGDTSRRLVEVEGIGSKRAAMIKRAWQEQKETREVMIFLQSHGVGASFAAKIFKRYGQLSIHAVRTNPYRLAVEIDGIGFATADAIAENLGYTKDSKVRVEAGILYVLNLLAEEGHVCYPARPLVQKCQETLGVGRELVQEVLQTLSSRRDIIIENIEGAPGGENQGEIVYLSAFHVTETGIAHKLKQLLDAPKAIREIDKDRAVEWVQRRLNIQLAKKQIEAVKGAAESKILVITGGPGTGKTTLIEAIISIFHQIGVTIQMAAPTGRAAKRMAEATGFEARTIHRLLEFNYMKGGFQRTEKRPLESELVIVDEASMIDAALMYHLLKAMSPGATFILVGDVNQLPSVGAGNVLNDIISSGVVPVIELNEIFRQAEMSSIVTNAHRINSGLMPDLKPQGNELEDFYFIEQDDPEEVLKIIIDLVRERIPDRFRYDTMEDIQVLAPMHRGVVGTANLNKKLQEVLNPGQAGLTRAGMSIRVGDKVMQIRNNYDKEVYNGDIGRIIKIDHELQRLLIAFEGRGIHYDYSDLDQIVLAYAITIHKSQGSEYPAVIVPLLTQHYVLLQRNLIYTAVTRGRKLVVVVGSKKALALAVRNDRTRKRYTFLAHRLSHKGKHTT